MSDLQTLAEACLKLLVLICVGTAIGGLFADTPFIKAIHGGDDE